MASVVFESGFLATCPTFILIYQSFVVAYSLGDTEVQPSKYKWREEYYHDLPIDHFSYAREDENNTFDMRYLINDTWWNPQGGCIFFYPGNEGDVTDFAKNTGLMWDWAPEFKAMLIFTEHRYYGESLPYGNKSHETAYLIHLSVDQVMADYAVFLSWLKENVTGAKDSPIIAFGGSYGGMLAAWMRVKYPHIINGALASSAPIMQLPGGEAPCSSFSTIATRTFAVSAPGCDKAVKRAWPIFFNRSKTADGREWLNENFQLCNDSLLTDEHSVDSLMYAVADAWRYMAMLDYPYPANMIRPLPAWPVRKACEYLTDPSGDDDEDAFLRNTFKATMIFYNTSGQSSCLDLVSSPVGNFDLNVWSFQACTELTFRRCQNATDMFRPYKWEEKWFSDACHKQYGVRPKLNWLTMNYGIERIKFASDIIFSSGELDPWSGSSVTQKSLEGGDPSLVVLNIQNAAHHYDLREANPLDTAEIIEARNRIKGIMHKWLSKSSNVQSAVVPQKPYTQDAHIEYNRLMVEATMTDTSNGEIKAERHL